MRVSLPQRLIGLAAALMVVAASLMSAPAMAPAAPDRPELAAYLTVAGSLSDLCGDPVGDQAHDCPFCRLLADTPPIGPAGRVERLAFGPGPLILSDLTRGPQHQSRHVSARAPPPLA